MNRLDVARKSFTIVSIAAAIYTIAEIIMQSLGTSICPTEGCRVVSAHTRFGDISILLLGLVVFVSLGVLSILERMSLGSSYGTIINIILIASLAAEGFFTGYQAFHVKIPCLFCLSILAIIVVLALLRLLSGERSVIAGYVSFAAVFVFLYLVLPAGTTESVPTDSRLILFYSDGCRHCTELRKEMEHRGISAVHLNVSGYSNLLKSFGIEHVPTLLVNEPYQRLFLTGREPIERFLFGKETAGKKQDAQKHHKATQKAPSLDILNTPIELFMPSVEPGVCKQLEECK